MKNKMELNMNKKTSVDVINNLTVPKDSKHPFSKSILKEYDIRGVVDKNLNEDDAYFIGRAYGTLLRRKYDRKNCVIGYDGRHSSPLFHNLAVEGLNDAGIDVVDIGLMPTPVVYFAVQFLDRDAGLIVTASHNPSEYNGFKMLTNEEPIWGEDIQEIGRLAKTGDFENGRGTLEQIDVKEDYFSFLLNSLEISNSQSKIAWDAGNGAVAVFLKEIVAKFPGQHLTICDEVDGDFPNHHPDPAVEKNMEMLKKTVVENNCDFGVAFDGDGDRIGVVTGGGKYIYGDQLLAILARDFLKKHPGEKVMSEVKASAVLYDEIVKNGGIPVMWKPGHSAQKAKMKSDNIKLAGETSGHVFYGDNHNYDDALYAALKLMNYLYSSGLRLDDVMRDFPKTYATSEVRVEVGDERKFALVKEIAQRLKSQGVEFIEVDGIRTNFADGWWLIRASNTQPDITLRCEALSEDGLKKCKDGLKRQLKLSGVVVEF